MSRLQRLFVVLLVATGLLSLVACTEKPEAPRFKLTDVTGASFGKDFALTDHNGQRRTLADFRGKVVTLFSASRTAPMSARRRWARWRW